MVAPLVIVAAKAIGSALLSSVLSKAANKGLDFLFEKEDTRLDEALRKLEVLTQRQNEIEVLIESLPSRAGLQGTVQKIHRQVRGLTLVIQKRKPTAKDFEKLQDFLGLTDAHSCRAMLDELTQRLFGSAVVTPAHFWNGEGAIDETGPVALGADCYLATQIRQFMTGGTGVQTLTAYADKVLGIHADYMKIAAYLGTAINVVYQFLKEHGQLPKDLAEQINPALLARPGLTGMVHDFATPYLVAPYPEALYLYARLQGQAKPGRVALLTRSRDFILEGCTDANRLPIAQYHADLGKKHYEVEKPIYAEYGKSMLQAGNLNLWWDIERAGPDATPGTVLLRPARDPKQLLGIFKYIYVMRETDQDDAYTMIWQAVFGMDDSKDRDEAGLSSEEKRGWFTVYVRLDKDKKMNFLFYNQFANGCLCTNEQPQETSRQVFFWGQPDDNTHKAYRLFVPGVSNDEAITDPALARLDGAGAMNRPG